MQTWFTRLWEYLRRLFVGDNEGEFVRPDPNADIGEELRRFFIELLKDENLRRFEGEGRNEYIDERARPDDWSIDHPEYYDRLGPDARRLLKSADLKELQGHIAQVPGSRAVLMFVVCPPM